MADNLIPFIGSVGKFELIAPFNNDLHPNSLYTCIATRRFADYTQTGTDPKVLYENKGISDAWTTDFNRGDVCIVTLQSSGGHIVNVPSTYIAAYPSAGGVPYTSLVLGISLGALPDGLDLSNLYTSMQNLVRDVIGVTSEVKSVAVSETTYVSQVDHNALTIARQDAIASSDTDRARALRAEDALATAQNKIAILEQYIRDHLPQP